MNRNTIISYQKIVVNITPLLTDLFKPLFQFEDIGERTQKT